MLGLVQRAKSPPDFPPGLFGHIDYQLDAVTRILGLSTQFLSESDYIRGYVLAILGPTTRSGQLAVADARATEPLFLTYFQRRFGLARDEAKAGFHRACQGLADDPSRDGTRDGCADRVALLVEGGESTRLAKHFLHEPVRAVLVARAD